MRWPADEKWAVVRALLAAGPVKRRLRREGYQETLAALSGKAGEAVPGGDARRIAMAAEAAMKRWPTGATCLERSLVVWWLLGGGAETQIRFGVAPGQGRPRFHAWVEHRGIVVNDDTDVADRYAPFEAAVPPIRFD